MGVGGDVASVSRQSHGMARAHNGTGSSLCMHSHAISVPLFSPTALAQLKLTLQPQPTRNLLVSFLWRFS